MDFSVLAPEPAIEEFSDLVGAQNDPTRIRNMVRSGWGIYALNLQDAEIPELHGANATQPYPQVHDQFGDMVSTLLLPSEKEPPPKCVTFTQVEEDCWVQRLPGLFEFMRKHNVGEIQSFDAPRQNPNSRNQLSAHMWLIDYPNTIRVASWSMSFRRNFVLYKLMNKKRVWGAGYFK